MKIKAHLPDIIFWVMCASAVLAAIVSSIKWGEPDGFHGRGFPFASVYWDKDLTTGRFLDYPNPLAPVMNFVVIFIAIAVILSVVLLLLKRFKKSA